MFNKQNRKVFFIVFGLLTSAFTYGGKLSYPAAGNMELNEGTLEVWLTPMADELYPPDDGKYYNVFDVFRLSIPGEWTIQSVWYRHKRQIGLKISSHSRDSEFGGGGIMGSEPAPDWKKGEMHHIAYVWKGKTLWLYVDGELRGSKTYGKGFWGSLEKVDLIFGYRKDGSDGDSRIILNAIKLSMVAKDKEALKNTRPEPNLATLLLDRFDSSDGIQGEGVIPEISYTLQEPTIGKLSGEWEYVTEPTAGIAFYKR